MRFLITGASSYVGARVYRALREEFDVLGTYHSNRLFKEQKKLDLSNSSEIKAIISKEKPEVIVHIAGLPLGQCAENSKLAHEINVDATRRIVETANEIGARIIYMSTIMAGKASDVYGKTKLEAEGYVAGTKAGFIVLRGALTIGQSPNTTAEKYYNRILRSVAEKSRLTFDNSALTQITYLGSIPEIISRSQENDKLWGQTIPVVADEKKTRFAIASDLLGEFGVTCEPSKGTRYIDEAYYTTEKLRELKLPAYNYRQIIKKTISEMHTWLNSRKT
ncbi:MAG: sugar nucleotide-binding protein [Candidatus Micrarchaeota archaeon]|nr:sugar nucleotide-binding protein [Candidatus Micrarchaeota archaeon]